MTSTSQKRQIFTIRTSGGASKWAWPLATLEGGRSLLFIISRSTVFCISSLEELRLEGCEVLGDNNDVTGNGDNGNGLKGLEAANMGECVHAYGDTSVGGVGKPEEPAAGVRLRDECVTRGLLGAVCRPPLCVVVTAGLVAERSTGVVVNLNWRPGPSRPA